MSKKKPKPSSVNNPAQTEFKSQQKNVPEIAKPGLVSSITNWLILLVILIPVLYSEKLMDNVIIRYNFMIGVLVCMLLYFMVSRKIPFQVPKPFLLKSVFVLGIAFALWSIVSMFSAINYREGYYEVSRHLLNMVLLFFVMTAISKEESQIVKLCKVLVLVALLQSFVGILQYYELAFTELPGAVGTSPYGLMANRNLFGSAQAFMLPFVVYIFYKAGKLWKAIAAVAVIGIIISLLLSQTRSAWIAAALFFIFSLVLVLIFSPKNRKKWIISFMSVIVCITAIVFIVLATDKQGSLTQSVKERTKSLTLNTQKDTAVIELTIERFKIWSKTISLIKDKPITGAGPGNWKINIPAYGTDGLAWADGKVSPDRPHNVYLLVAAETGIPGAILYFGMWVFIVIVAFKVIYKPQSEDQRILNMLMLCGLAAFAADSVFSFPTERIEHTLYIMLMGGIILGSYKSIAGVADVEKRTVNKTLIFSIVAILIFNLFIGYKKYNYEIHLNRAKAFENINNFSEMLNEAEAGKSDFITMGPETGLTLQLKSSIALKELKQYDKALTEINIAKSYHPYNANIWSTMGTIYTDLKQYDKAVPCYEKALQFAPYYDIVLKNLAVNYFLVNKYEACIKTLNKLNIVGDVYLTGLFNEATRKMNEKK